MSRPSSDELLSQAAEADVPEAATRLRREAAAAREDELRRALDLVASAVEGLSGQDLVRLGDRLAGLFGSALARLHGAPRLERLEALQQAVSAGRQDLYLVRTEDGRALAASTPAGALALLRRGEGVLEAGDRAALLTLAAVEQGRLLDALRAA